MKVYAVLVVAICAISLVSANKILRTSYLNDDNSDFSDEPSQSVRKQLHQIPMDAANTMSETDEVLNPDTTDVFPFRYKITKRLESSLKLSANPEAREKLINYFEDKVKICRVPSAGLNQVNKHCVGRLIGQMMLMVASAENDFPSSSMGW